MSHDNLFVEESKSPNITSSFYDKILQFLATEIAVRTLSPVAIIVLILASLSS
jgi:hypothetical protein